jgi:hypothetical protein
VLPIGVTFNAPVAACAALFAPPLWAPENLTARVPEILAAFLHNCVPRV